MTDPTETESPLATIPSANQPAFTMQERAFRGYLNLRGQPEQTAFIDAVRSATGLGLPIKPNTVADSAQLSALWLAPNEWLLVTPPGAHAELPAALRQALGNLFAAVVDVSSGYTTIEIRGPETRDLLARGCAVDLHPRVFGPGQCAQTLLAKAQVTIVKVGSPPRFHVIVRRSMAEYLWRWLDDAARDLSSSLGSGRER